jgi:signal transduction histidine kinase
LEKLRGFSLFFRDDSGMSAQRQLAAMSEAEELIVDRLETAVWVYDFERGSITWANRRALELWDAGSIAELAGRRLHNEMSPSVRTRLAQHMDDFRLCPDREIREFWTLYPGGKPFRVRATLRRHELPFGRLGMLVEAHKEELTQPETIRSADALLYTSVITALFDEDGAELYANPAFRQAFGPGRHRLGSDFVAPELAEAFIGNVKTAGEHRETVLVHTVDGKRWHEMLAKRCRDAVTGEYAILISAVDVTVAREYQDQLDAARRTAEAADRAKSIFLSTISHEMRTPLNGVLGISNLLARTDLDAQQQKMVSLVMSSGADMLEFIENALDVVDLDSNAVELKSEEFDVALLVSSVVEMFGDKARQKGLELGVDLEGLPHRKWRHDALQIRKVLRQLVSNAVKFSESGEIKVRVAALAGNTLRFEVIDNGPGVAPELGEKIFERFYQVDGSWTRRSGGSGLGLAICRRIVSLWGGEVQVSPRSDTGSIFWFTVPGAIPSIGR